MPNPYYNVSSFIGFRTEAERAEYENVLDFNKNWYDRASYAEFHEFEQKILQFMKNLYQNYFKRGFLTIDSSEAIYIALLIHLRRFKKKHQGVKPNFLISELGHIVYQKAAVLLDVDMVEVGLGEMGEMSIADLKNKINPNTFCVVGIPGSTEMGSYDDLIAIDTICKQASIPFHIDAAIGGFIFPFRSNPKIHTNFSSFESIQSMNISGHKYGYARPSAGILLIKDETVFNNFYPVTTVYLPGGPSDEYGLTGSKPAIGLIDLHHNITTWKEKGYQVITDQTFRQKNGLITSLEKIDERLAVYDSGDTPIFLLYGKKKFIDSLSHGLAAKGWINSSHHNAFLDAQTIRIVVRKHFTKEYCATFAKEVTHVATSV